MGIEGLDTVILSLGGALIVPDTGIDSQFLKEFEKFVRKKVAEGRRFFIVCGGGRTARQYRDAGAAVIGAEKVTSEDLDWLGVHATRLNAHLLRTIFRDIAHPRIIDRYDRKLSFTEPVVIAAGWKPGWSTDYCATLLANMYKIKTVINMSNIDMVFTKDPRKFKDAKPIERTSWDYFKTLVGSKWNPGMNVPFDPIATQNAADSDLTVVVLKGSNISNLERMFDGKKFKGTVITPFTLDASFFDREYFEGGVVFKHHGYTTSFLGRLRTRIGNLYRAMKIALFFRPRKLLDVGCATGKMVRYLRKVGVDAHGLEVSEYALSKAANGVKPYLHKGNILEIPYENNSFDVVTSINVLEHVERDKIIQALQECNRVAKKFIIHKIFTSENWWLHKSCGQDISCISVFPIEWWKDLFAQNGFVESKRIYIRLPKFMETVFILEKKR